MSRPYTMVTDYTGRQVDLEAFNAPDSPNYDVRVVLGMRLDTTPRRLAGIEKLVQRYVNLMLTPIGAVHHDLESGSLLLRDLRLGGSYTADQLLHSFIFANAQVLNQLRSEDANPDYGTPVDDEMIASANIVQARPDYQTGHVHVTIRLVTRSGDQATFVVPLGPTDARVQVPAPPAVTERTRWVPPSKIPGELPAPSFAVRVVTTGTPEDFILQTDNAADLVIYWGEGSPDTYNGTGLRTHSYATPGTYTITFIKGTATRIAFGGAGCTPTLVTEVITPVPVSLGLTSTETMFYQCTGITAWAASFFDAASANITDFSFMFRSVATFNEDVSGWNTSSAVDMTGIFRAATVFNQDIGGWDVSSVQKLASMFYDSQAFNQDIGGWNTSSVVDMKYMFNNALAFNQDVSEWNVTALTHADNMFNGSAFAQVNYDLLLVGWEAQTVQDNVTLHAGAAKYGAGAPATARAALIADHTWAFTDGGPA